MDFGLTQLTTRTVICVIAWDLRRGRPYDDLVQVGWVTFVARGDLGLARSAMLAYTETH